MKAFTQSLHPALERENAVRFQYTHNVASAQVRTWHFLTILARAQRVPVGEGGAAVATGAGLAAYFVTGPGQCGPVGMAMQPVLRTGSLVAFL